VHAARDKVSEAHLDLHYYISFLITSRDIYKTSLYTVVMVPSLVLKNAVELFQSLTGKHKSLSYRAIWLLALLVN
jgi:hypothetical protein